ncbi:hypothetical protein Q5752_003069 [Cryptotrichosporon argae]
MGPMRTSGGGQLSALPPLPAPSLSLERKHPDRFEPSPDREPLGSGKKRRIPSVEDDEGALHDCRAGPDVVGVGSASAWPSHVRFRAGASTTVQARRKLLFLGRKAALMALYLDAQKAVASVQPGRASTLPDVKGFEKLLPALESVGVADWPMDRAHDSGAHRRLGAWRAAFERRRRERSARQPVVRGGWAPEGSFEVEMPTTASHNLRMNRKDHQALVALAAMLESVIETSKEVRRVQEAAELKLREKEAASAALAANEAKLAALAHEKLPAKALSTASVESDVHTPATAETAQTSAAASTSGEKEHAPTSAPAKKKNKKKKKRSVLANQSNPHHVDNYKPSRTPTGGDPFEPWPHHANLLFPPSMRLLSARPQRKKAPLPGAAKPSPPAPERPAEDDFLCCFCEVALYYSTEQSRRRAIRARRKELQRREALRTKARNVAEGRSRLHSHSDDEDESDFDGYEDEECDDHGRCTCGRAIRPKRADGDEPAAPDKDPPWDDELD